MNNIIPYEVFKKKLKDHERAKEHAIIKKQLDRFGLLDNKPEEKVHLKGQEIPNLLKDLPLTLNFFDNKDKK